MIRWVIILVLSVIALVGMVLYWSPLLRTIISVCSADGKPTIIGTGHDLSPDGKWEFTVEHLDNGLGFGFGALYYEVHVHKPGLYRFRHGDREKTTVFYVLDTYASSSDAPAVQWLDSRHLLIEYSDENKPGRMKPRYGVVEIEYRPIHLWKPSMGRRLPNQAPDPTALAVTPAANAPVAPAGGRGSS